MTIPHLDSYMRLFAGRPDAYATVSEVIRGKARYSLVEKPLTEQVYASHLKGDDAVGIYPIVNNKVKWGAIDIDGPKDEETKEFLPDGWKTIWPEALKQRNALRAAGLYAYIERSRSGNGAHVWVFFDEWVPAHKVRALLYNLLTVEKKTAEVVYPVQAAQTGKGYGNLLALPYNGEAVTKGNSCFLNDQGEVIPLETFVTKARVNRSDILPELEEEATAIAGKANITPSDTRPEKALRGALKVISPYGCQFMHHAWTNRKNLPEPEWYVAIQQTTAFAHGREFAHAISRDYPKYDAREVDKKFDQAMGNATAGCAYIREHFPHLACPNCPGRAPFNVAEKSIIKLVSSSSGEIERVGSFKSDLMEVRAYDDGTASSGIEWGVPLISKHNKLRASELTVVGGFPSLGKTWFMIDNAVKMAMKGIVVFIFSAETARKQLRQRFLSNVSGVDLSALRGERATKLTKFEWEQLEKASALLETLPIYTDYTSMSPAQVMDQIETILLANRLPLDCKYVIFFDYLQFGFREPGEESDTERIGRLAGEFKFVAKITDHPAVLFSQLRRDKEDAGEDDSDGQDVIPQLNWLANSSNVERTADVIIFMTGKRVGGLFAPRQLYTAKDRDGVAPVQDHLVLRKNCGEWMSGEVQTSQDSYSESLTQDFNVRA